MVFVVKDAYTSILILHTIILLIRIHTTYYITYSHTYIDLNRIPEFDRFILFTEHRWTHWNTRYNFIFFVLI